MTDKIIAYKGFDSDLKCRGHQFAVGETFSIDGEIKICERGFHSCEYPLDVFSFYAPAESRFAEVEVSGDTDQNDHGNTKIASASIAIKAEISLHVMIERAVAWVFDRADWEKGPAVKADKAGAVNDNDRGAASSTGDQGAASALGPHSVALAAGSRGKARAAKGSAFALIYRDNEGRILRVVSAIAGQDGIKPEVFYTLDESGQIVEAGQ